MAKTKNPDVTAKPAVPGPRPSIKTFFSKLVPKFGPFEVYGCETVPAGAIRVDVADVYPVYVIKFWVLHIALDIGRDK